MSARHWMLAGCAAAALAAGACGSKTTEPPVTHSSMADSADQTLFGVRMLMTDRGLMRAETTGDTLFFFDDNTRIELRKVHMTFYATNGAKNAVLTSREGTFNTRTNVMEARGDVVVVTEDGRRLTTPQLRFDQGRNEVSSDSAFVLTDPDRRVAGIGFVSDPDLNNIRILKTTSGQGGAVTIPGQ